MGTDKVKFKSGDRVRLARKVDCAMPKHNIKLGGVYVVHHMEQSDSGRWWVHLFHPCGSICSTPICGGWDPESFELVKDEGPSCPELEQMAAEVKTAFASARPAIDGAGVKGCMTSPKDPLELIDPDFPQGISKVLLKGAKKYAPHNWLRGMSWETVMGGILRHLTAFRQGEELDPETGLPHLHHAACGIMFLSHYAHGPKASDYRKFDDRAFRREAA